MVSPKNSCITTDHCIWYVCTKERYRPQRDSNLVLPCTASELSRRHIDYVDTPLIYLLVDIKYHCQKGWKCAVRFKYIYSPEQNNSVNPHHLTYIIWLPEETSIALAIFRKHRADGLGWYSQSSDCPRSWDMWLVELASSTNQSPRIWVSMVSRWCVFLPRPSDSSRTP